MSVWKLAGSGCGDAFSATQGVVRGLMSVWKKSIGCVAHACSSRTPYSVTR
jgi:hypothetical protein